MNDIDKYDINLLVEEILKNTTELKKFIESSQIQFITKLAE